MRRKASGTQMQNDGAVLFPEGLMGHLVSWRSARRAAVVADELYAPRDALLVGICLYREGERVAGWVGPQRSRV